MADRLFVTAKWAVNTEQVSVPFLVLEVSGHVKSSRTILKVLEERWNHKEKNVH